MVHCWFFNEYQKGDRYRNPIQGQFFADESIDRPGEALVREGIQNSLDAARPGENVLVRMKLVGIESGISRELLEPFTRGLWPHVDADGNGLRNAPNPAEPCAYLVFEDHGTTGLVGDPAQWQLKPEAPNDFFNFFRADGQSDKGEGSRGRWGVGKWVFPRTSRVSAVLGLTVRHDDGRRLLMGTSVLRSHQVGEKSYNPDGWFAIPKAETKEDLPMPIENEAVLRTFENLFHLQRGTDPGLSIVIPWYDAEIKEQDLVRAVLRDYFWPILTGRLEVIVETPGIQTVLDARSLPNELQKIDGELEHEILPLVKLARWFQELDKQQVPCLNMAQSKGALRWSRDLFPSTVLGTLRSKYEQGQPIALRVPLTVRPKDGKPRESYFTVLMSRDEQESSSGRAVFIRAGIIITGVRSPRVRGLSCLVVADDEPLATLLGDSEDPGHKVWQKGGDNFKNKYTYGPSYLDFVTNSMYEIARVLADSEQKTDTTLLTALFSLAVATETTGPKPPVPRPGLDGGRREEPPPPPPPAPQPKSFRINPITGDYWRICGPSG